jgi:hypothetical protein
LLLEPVQKDEKLPIEKRRRRLKPNKSKVRRSIMCICGRERRVYASDVTEKEWAILRQKTAHVGGHPRTADVGQSARSFLG